MSRERKRNADTPEYAKPEDIAPSDYEQNEPSRRRFAGRIKIAGATILAVAAVVGITLFFTVGIAALALAGPAVILFGILAASIAALMLTLAGYVAYQGHRDVHGLDLADAQTKLDELEDHTQGDHPSPSETHVTQPTHGATKAGGPDLAHSSAAEPGESHPHPSHGKGTDAAG